MPASQFPTPPPVPSTPAAEVVPEPLASATTARELGTFEPPFGPSAAQRRAIEAELGPVLVLAGPGAGKTYCLIERIRHLIERRSFDPSRICAFTFTNKAAEEIAARLRREVGQAGEAVRRQTLHAFCSEILREHCDEAGLRPGFGIADEALQLTILARLGQTRWAKESLNRFTRHRFQSYVLRESDARLFNQYLAHLGQRNIVDFDMLILKVAQLMTRHGAAATALRARWDYVLVDEFQDLNPQQYAIVRELAREHNNLFAVGDDEQSIFSWTGADPKVFTSFVNDFGLHAKVELDENRRCSRQVFEIARRLIAINRPIFDESRTIRAVRESPYPVDVVGFADDSEELTWLVGDITTDQQTNRHTWGDVAVLYRTHATGEMIEGALLSAGIPCRLAHGRAIAEDPVIRYVLAALRIIERPEDDLFQEEFFRIVLPPIVYDEYRARAEQFDMPLLRYLRHVTTRLPKASEDRKKITRALSALRNFDALGRSHQTLESLVRELLSQRVGEYRTPLEDNHLSLTDPIGDATVHDIARQLRDARERHLTLWLSPSGGAALAIRGMVAMAGYGQIHIGPTCPANAVPLAFPADATAVLPLLVFKALQLLESASFESAFTRFTAIDIETTGNDIKTSEIIEIAAVRVRDGRMVDRFQSLVRPHGRISPDATKAHGLRDVDVAGARRFEDVWPAFRDFCGDDTLVAHNGNQFDFPILRRQSRKLRGADFKTYDSLPDAKVLHSGSHRLADLARSFGINPGNSHRALDDAQTLAQVFLRLEEAKLARMRKTSLVSLLDYLAAGLALSGDHDENSEATLLLKLGRGRALGRYSDVLEYYRVERDRLLGADDEETTISALLASLEPHDGVTGAADTARVPVTAESLPTVDELIERLGGHELMDRVRAERSPEDRYPSALARLNRLLAECKDGALKDQIARLFELVALSRSDGVDVYQDRVNLLTLHSTKGLEFSRVYVVGVEDTQFVKGPPDRSGYAAELEEARRLLYVGMTRTRDRLVLTRSDVRGGKPTGGAQFLNEMGLTPVPMSATS